MQAKGETSCFRCHANRHRYLKDREHELHSEFGKGCMYDWADQFRHFQDRVRQTREAQPVKETIETGFKEDGKFWLRYQAICPECGFRFEYEV